MKEAGFQGAKRVLDELVQRGLYLKLCWNRANSHVAVFSGAINLGLLLMIFFQDKPELQKIAVALIGLVVTTLLMVGHFDLKSGIACRETSLNNKYNPEIQKLLTSQARSGQELPGARRRPAAKQD